MISRLELKIKEKISSLNKMMKKDFKAIKS